ncbi:unnamed protein product [Albugo candida]|uniref:Uncharacterized protein n=1 Tax=Albugo candida TaxID=65357 RepID=A0A024FX54_9STRA|nr:unnamed protein product [Albugo candida]|eukprot:CCI11705.1 unnamed protein product [Albugo candida]
MVWANAKDDQSEAYVPGKKLLLGAMAMHQLTWCGSSNTFISMREAFVKSKGKKNWNPLQWLSSHSWDDALEMALHEAGGKADEEVFEEKIGVRKGTATFKSDPESKRRLQTLLRKAYEFVPRSEKTSLGEDAFFVYKKVLELGSSAIEIIGLQNSARHDSVGFTMGSILARSLNGFPYNRNYDISTVLPVAISAISRTNFVEFWCGVFIDVFEVFILNFQVMMINIFQYLSTIKTSEEEFVRFEKHSRRVLHDSYTEFNMIAQNLNFIDQIAKLLSNDLLLHDNSHARCKGYTDHGRPTLHAVCKTVKEIYAHFKEKSV